MNAKILRCNPTKTLRVQGVFHIPVDCFNPGTYWIICLDRDSFLPTDNELEQLRSYREYIVRGFYDEGHAKRILDLDLPECSGHNTTIFRKGIEFLGIEGGWSFRKMTWRSGPLYFPNLAEEIYRGITLVGLLDRIENLLP